MTRSDILTLSPRLARRALASAITLSLEEELNTLSSSRDLMRVMAVCSLCDRYCRIGFQIRGGLSCVSVENLVGRFYLLCRGLEEEKVQGPSAVLDGQSHLISDAPSEVQ